MNYSNYGQYGHSPHLDAMRNEELMTISVGEQKKLEKK
jgi:hypothetical protein